MRLSWYIAKDLVILILTSYVSLLGFFSIFELAEFMRVVTQAQKPPALAWEMTAWNLLIITNDVGPLSLLVAMTLLGATLTRRNEIVAIAASGISPRTVLVPIIACGVAFSAMLFVIADRATPIAATRVERIMAGELGRARSAQYFSRHRQWFKTGETFVRVGSIDPRAQTYHDLSIVALDKGHVTSRTTAETVHAIGNELVGSNVTIERYPADPTADLELENRAEAILPLERGFNLFLDLFSRPQNMHLGELREVFSHRARHGYDPRLYENEYWGRLAAPFTTLGLALFGASLAFAVRPKRNPLWSLVELLGLTLAAFVMRQSFRAFATDGTIPAAAGAAIPALIFFALLARRMWKGR